MSGVRHVLNAAAVAGSGAMAGLFLTFSSFTMTGLRRLPAAQGLAAMQSINRAAGSSPLLLVGLFGTAALSVTLGATALGQRDDPSSRWLLAGAALYLTGVVVTTVGYHVPHNRALDRLDPDLPSSAATWRADARAWTRWNHVRTLSALGAGIAYTMSWHR